MSPLTLYLTLACLAIIMVNVRSISVKKRQSQPFYVDGTNIPGVDMVVPDSYAGILPTTKKEENGGMFFWYHPATQDSPGQDDLTIWIQGGQGGGCSSLQGMLQETGPWLLPMDGSGAVPNPYSFTNLSHMLYVELPTGTGFSNDLPERDSGELSRAFYMFLVNFFKAFPDLHGKRLWLTGDGRAAWYLTYIAYNIIFTNKPYTDDDGINLQGFAMYGPIISDAFLQQQVPVVEFATTNQNLMDLDDAFIANIQAEASQVGLGNAVANQLQYPPLTPQFDNSTVSKTDDFPDLYSKVHYAAKQDNPCFSSNNIAYQCPTPNDPLGAPHDVDDDNVAQTSSRRNFINDTPGLKQYIHAVVEHVWQACSFIPFRYYMTSFGPPSSTDGALSLVIDNVPSKRNLIVNGELDFIAMPDATALGLQFTSWYDANGDRVQGFPTSTATPVIVDGAQVGTMQTKGSLGFVRLDNVGHRVGLDAPNIMFKLHQYLLGQIQESDLYIY